LLEKVQGLNHSAQRTILDPIPAGPKLRETKQITWPSVNSPVMADGQTRAGESLDLGASVFPRDDPVRRE
jgi:hypothetical protein